ncbi:MAG: hypothetical protein VX262_06120 [Acidobacteriota bacterium]|nr:hypothetical protein [Acidobacteriota bacterium]
MSSTRAASAVFGIVLCVYLTTTGGSFATDLASYEVTKNLVQRGSVAMSYDVLETDAERGLDGQYYAPVGIGHPLVGVPFYLASRVVQQLFDIRVGKPETVDKAAVVVGSTVTAALCAPLVFLFAWRITGSLVGALFAAFALAFGTSLWPYSKFGFNAPLATLCLLGATYSVWIGVRSKRLVMLAWGGALLGYGLLTRHELGIMVIPLAGWIVIESVEDRKLAISQLAVFGVPVVIGVVLWMSYNFARFGHPFDTGLLRDPNVRFDTPVLVGLYGLLASPGRAWFLYCPIVAGGVASLWLLARRDRSTAVLFGAQACLLLAVICRMHQWDGGESYGPRYLIPVLPFVTIPLAASFSLNRVSRLRRLLPVILTVSVLVQLPGVLVDYSKTQNAFARQTDNYSIEMSRYSWAGAPLKLNTEAAFIAIPRNLAYVTGRMAIPPVSRTGEEAQRDFSQQFSFSLDFWWLYLFYLGVLPVGFAVMCGFLPLILASAITVLLLKGVHSSERPAV